MATAADLVNPLLVACALAAPFLAKKSPWKFWLRIGAALVLVYAVTFVDRWLGTGKGRDFDFSTHTAFATVVGTSLAAIDRLWLRLVIPALIAYGVMMIRLDYHTPVEFLVSVVIFAPATWAIHRYFL